jgi:hypothetical protein
LLISIKDDSVIGRVTAVNTSKIYLICSNLSPSFPKTRVKFRNSKDLHGCRDSISFSHKSFPDFLTNYSKRHFVFYVDKNKRHRHFANYLLKSLNASKNVDIIDLAHHVALSENQEYEDLFLLYASDIKAEFRRQESCCSVLFVLFVNIGDTNTFN